MKRPNWQLVSILAVCALLPVMTASAKNVHQRPFKAHGQTIVVIDSSTLDPSSGAAEWTVVEEIGMGTHTGRWTSQGGGTVYFDAALNPVHITGSGFITVASGDVISWESADGVVTFIDGTGRLVNVSGSFIQDQEITDQEQVGWSIFLTIRWTARGTLSY